MTSTPAGQLYVEGARALALAGKHRQALELLGRALRAAPRSAVVWYEIGLVLTSQGDREEAVEAFDHVLDLDPGDAQAHFQRGVLLAEIGRTSEALIAFKTSVEIHPDFHDAVKSALAIPARDRIRIDVN